MIAVQCTYNYIYLRNVCACTTQVYGCSFMLSYTFVFVLRCDHNYVSFVPTHYIVMAILQTDVSHLTLHLRSSNKHTSYANKKKGEKMNMLYKLVGNIKTYNNIEKHFF